MIAPTPLAPPGPGPIRFPPVACSNVPTGPASVGKVSSGETMRMPLNVPDEEILNTRSSKALLSSGGSHSIRISIASQGQTPSRKAAAIGRAGLSEVIKCGL